MTEEEKKLAIRKIQLDLNKQITFIALNGCRSIKCKNCYLKGFCDHIPGHSSQFASKIIQMSKEVKE